MTGVIQLERRVPIIQGEYYVSREQNLVLTTVLGSCVSACLHDPHAQVGGMNHFLLPGEDVVDPRGAERYGAYLMELLVNGLMQLGARRDRLHGKLFGGARVLRGLSDVGRKNGEFAERFLHCEGIVIASRDLGGDKGRRVQFWPASGRARRGFIEAGASIGVERARPPAIERFGDVELFDTDPKEPIVARG